MCSGCRIQGRAEITSQQELVGQTKEDGGERGEAQAAWAAAKASGRFHRCLHEGTEVLARKLSSLVLYERDQEWARSIAKQKCPLYGV